MSIKPVDSIPCTNGQYLEKQERLKRDIVDIIEGRVIRAEIVGYDSPNSTMRGHIQHAIISVAYKQYHVRVNSSTKCFNIHSRKVNGKTHWYVEFNTEQWDLERTKLGK